MSPSPTIRLPLRIRLVAWMMLLLALWNLVRGVVLLQEIQFLAEQGLGFNALVRLLVAFGWSAGFLLMALGFRQRWSFARPGAMLITSGYALYNLLLLALFVQSPVERLGWPARLLGYIITLIIMAWLLYRPERIFPETGSFRENKSKRKEGK